MLDVYSKAEQVLVWLGPAADRSDELMDLCQDVGLRAQNMGMEDYFTREKMPILQAISNNPLLDYPLTKPYHELVDLARPGFEGLLQEMIYWNERHWFHRVWVIQEVSLCRDTVFVCGHKVIPVEHFRLALHIFTSAMKKAMRSRPDSDKGFRELAYRAQCHRVGPLLSTRRRRQNFNKDLGTGDDLFHLLRKLFVESDTRATKKRDRIYGLLGLAADAEELGITPNYACKDSGPIFASVARSMIQKGRVEVLSFSQFPKEDDLKNLPSWAPDWRPMLAPSYYTIWESAEDHLLAASGDTQVSLEPVEDPSILGIRGYLVDVIEEVGETWHTSDAHPLHHRLLNSIASLCAKSAAKGEPIYSSAFRRATAVWRVPVGDLYWTKETDHARADLPRSRDEYHDCLFVFAQLAAWETMTPDERKIRLQEVNTRRFGSASYRGNMNTMTGKKPYLTRTGYVGMCPEQTVEGDVVVILRGARIPYILRPSNVTKSDEFSFVGEAYCDGVMDGEILERSEETVFSIK
ncbi:hypothetical protein ACJ41O_011348 [Fusarium nematophilum]